MRALLVLSLVLPLLLALGLGSRLRSLAIQLVPVVALPALLLAASPGLEIDLSWILLGMRLGVDNISALFLLLTGLVWTASGCYARQYMRQDSEQTRFYFFYLLTYCGNLGVMLALDAASFYLFFTVLSLAAYGLIVHDGSALARRAGRVYLILAMLGEVLLLIALLQLGAVLGNPPLNQLAAALAALPDQDVLVGFVLAGFAIKMGVVPLHVWLALAHPAAPTPASAVLSGIIIKAGLVGWLRFLPLGEMALPQWGALCLGMGLFSTFYGALVGVPQESPKTVLAYSSISQMGLLTSLLGIGLMVPQSWLLILATMLLFSLHHGLTKAALFLGVGITGQSGAWAGWILVLPALALTGAPLTSGALAKLLVKNAASVAPAVWTTGLTKLLSLSSLATALLMIRFLYLAWPHRQKNAMSPWLWLPWLSLIALGAWLPWWWASGRFPGAAVATLKPDVVIESLWILLAAGVLALTVWGSWRAEGFSWYLPEGDILQPISRLIRLLPRNHASAKRKKRLLPARPLGRIANWLRGGDQWLRLWNVIGTVFLLLTIGLLTLLIRG